MAAPIGHTCPDIDKALKIIKWLQRESRNFWKHDEKEIADFASTVDDDLSDVCDILEDLRNDNSILREYGEEQESIAEDYLNKLNSVNYKFY